MDPITAMASVGGALGLVATVLTTFYQYGSSVMDGPREIKALFQEITSLTNVLRSIHALGGQASHPTTASKLTEAQAKALGAPLEDCEKVLYEVLEALNQSHGPSNSKARTLLKKLAWPLKETQTLALVAKLERTKSTIATALAIESLSTGMATLSTVKNIEATVGNEKLQRETSEATNRAVKMYRWLCDVNIKVLHETACSLQYSGTGRWLMINKCFLEWANNESNFLWLNGISGSGKTVLTANIVRHHVLSQIGNGNLGAYFYCDFRQCASQQPMAVLGSLIAQLCQGSNDTGILAMLEDFYSAHQTEIGQTSDPTFGEVRELFFRILKICPGVTTIVIDGLDECYDRTNLLRTLIEVSSTKTIRARVLISSRPEWEIRQVMDQLPSLSLQSPAVAQTPTRFAQYRTIDFKFRWTHLQIEELDKLCTNRDIRQALTRLPKDLDNTYARMLNQIDSRYSTYARQALLWLTFAMRPLTLVELAGAAVLRSDATLLDPDDSLIDPHMILEILGSLVTYNESQGEVVLAHNSIRDFLIADSSKSLTTKYHLKEPLCRVEIADLCLTYLLLNNFATGPCQTPDEFKERISTYLLLPYTAQHWTSHIHPLLAENPSLLQKAMHLMTPKTPNFLSWHQVLLLATGRLPRFNYPFHAPTWGTPLYYAASYGLSELVNALIDAGADINAPGGWNGGTPLHAAVFRGRVSCARILLERGADAEIKDRIDTSPVELAMMSYDLMRQVFVERGFDLEDVEKNYEYHHRWHRRRRHLDGWFLPRSHEPPVS